MADTDFAVSGKTTKMEGFVNVRYTILFTPKPFVLFLLNFQQEECCGYGNAGVGTSGKYFFLFN